MRIASFNLESLETVTRAGVTLAARAEVLRPQLERLRADILCLQEVNGERLPGERQRGLPALDQLLEGTVYARWHRTTTTARGADSPADVHNLVIVSRLPIVSHRQIHHLHVAPHAYRFATALPPAAESTEVHFERPILLAEIDTGDTRPLHVFNVHLRAPLASPIPGQKESAFVWRSTRGWAEGYFLSAMKRSGQALELRLAIDGLLDRDPHAHILACGDFNAEDHETPLKVVIGAEEDTGNGLLAHRSMVVLDRSVPADRRFSVVHLGYRQMVDHILASRALLARFAHVEVHNEALGDELVAYARVHHATGSCHAPVVAELHAA